MQSVYQRSVCAAHFFVNIDNLFLKLNSFLQGCDLWQFHFFAIKADMKIEYGDIGFLFT